MDYVRFVIQIALLLSDERRFGNVLSLITNCFVLMDRNKDNPFFFNRYVTL